MSVNRVVLQSACLLFGWEPWPFSFLVLYYLQIQPLERSIGMYHPSHPLVFSGRCSNNLLCRQGIVSKYNVKRERLIDNNTTPLQVGNGNFAFNVDNTGMQVTKPSYSLRGTCR